jgi:hypothetical protein
MLKTLSGPDMFVFNVSATLPIQCYIGELSAWSTRNVTFGPISKAWARGCEEKVFKNMRTVFEWSRPCLYHTLDGQTLAHHCVSAILRDDIAIRVMEELHHFGALLDETDLDNNTPYDLAVAQQRHELAQKIAELADTY